MAYPIKVGSSVRFFHHCLLDRLSLAALLGVTMGAWVQVERHLMFLYGYLMGLELHRSEGFSPPIHPVALQVFDTLDTLHHRIRLLEELASWRLEKFQDLKEQLQNLVIPCVRKAAKARNTLAHANWGICDQYPESIIDVPVFGQAMAYEARDFNEAIEKCQNATVAVRDFESRVRSALGDH